MRAFPMRGRKGVDPKERGGGEGLGGVEGGETLIKRYICI